MDMKNLQTNLRNPDSEPSVPIPVGETVEADWAVWEELVADSGAAADGEQSKVLPNEASGTS